MRFTRSAAFVSGLILALGAGNAAAGGLGVVLSAPQQPGPALSLELPGLLQSSTKALGLVLGGTSIQSGALLELGDVAIGLPGLDGLGTVIAPGTSPLSQLNSALVHALRSVSGQAALSSAGSSALMTPLPGLGNPTGTALPGLAGLPIGATEW